MSKRVLMFLVASLIAGGSAVAYARGGGGGGGMGGMSGSHMSSQGMANTNGPEAADRDRGRERAEDRQRERATSREAATEQKRARSRNQNGETAGSGR